MTLTVVSPGLYSRPVGSPCPGRRALGVPPGGPADREAFALANALLGNPPGAVAIEVTLAGPTLRADTNVAAVLFGAPFEAKRNGVALEPNTTFTLEPGDVLSVGGTPTGCRAYLAVGGGSDAAGEAVKAGDVLRCEPSRMRSRRIVWTGADDSPIRVLPGPQRDWFPDDSFFTQTFTVSAAADRMGVRLLGDPLAKRAGELASEPVAAGAVQVTNDGLPVVLGVDGQTIGGYPKVAHVIRADLDRVGRLRPGDAVRFREVGVEEAEEAAEVRARELRRWVMRLGLGVL